MTEFNERFRLTRNGPLYADGCSRCEYEPTMDTTVGELCRIILSHEGGWGHIDACGARVEYERGGYVGEARFPESVMRLLVRRVMTYGGWTMSDWDVETYGEDSR